MRLIQRPNDQSGGTGLRPVTAVYSLTHVLRLAEEHEQVEQLVVDVDRRVRWSYSRADVERDRRARCARTCRSRRC